MRRLLECSFVKIVSLIVAVLVAACGAKSPPVQPGATASEILRAPIERYVASGKTPAAFAELAVTLGETIEAARATPDVADEADLRLLALAAPLVESTRTQPVDAQVALLGATVWPALAGDRPRANESAEAFVARQCAALPACTALPVERRPLAVRAAVIHSAARQMRTALDRCMHCDAEWRSIGSRWESFDAQAMRATL